MMKLKHYIIAAGVIALVIVGFQNCGGFSQTDGLQIADSKSSTNGLNPSSSGNIPSQGNYYPSNPIPGGSSQTPNGGSSQTPNGGSSQTPNGGSSQTPNGGSSQTPNGGSSQTPNGGSSQTPNGGSSQTPGLPHRCVTLSLMDVLLGFNSISAALSADPGYRYIGVNNIVYDSSGKVVAVYKDKIGTFGPSPSFKNFNAQSVSFWITPFLLENTNRSSVVVQYDVYQSVDERNWSYCTTIPVTYRIRSYSEGSCQIPPGVEETSCGANGVNVFIGGVCKVFRSSANPSLQQKYFECVKSGNTTDWREVTSLIQE
jgi:hypothetical protein